MPLRAKRNAILACLSGDEFERLAPHMEAVELELGATIEISNLPPKYVYFPLSGIVSLLLLLRDGGTGEIAVVGAEGLLGQAAFLGGPSRADVQGMVQARGHAMRIPAEHVQREFRRCGTFQNALLLHTRALMMQISQTALCNRHHTLERQLARWLLLNLDRVRDSKVLMTQEMIANMLGVRREGVNNAARNLQERGLIQYTRGRIEVPERDKLAVNACECYQVIHQEYEGLYQDLASKCLQ